MGLLQDPQQLSIAADRLLDNLAIMSACWSACRDARQLTTVADVLLVMDKGGLSNSSTVQALRPLTGAQSMEAAACLIKGAVEVIMAEEQAIMEIQRCLEAVRAAE
jgi:hypothetical protein